MTVLVVSNQKGGVGKTTTAISLGAAMVERGQRVLIVDLDPQANATSGLGISKERANGIYGVLLKERPLLEAIVPTELAGLDLVPSGPDMAGAEVELVPVMAREFRLRDALREASGYDTVIVDCPPSLGVLTINGLTVADQVLVPLQCEALSHRGVAQLLETIDDVRLFANPALTVRGIIATMYDGRTRHSRAILDDVRSRYGLNMLDPPVPKSVRFAEAPAQGRSILRHASSSAGAEAYRAIARTLHGDLTNDDVTT